MSVIDLIATDDSTGVAQLAITDDASQHISDSIAQMDAKGLRVGVKKAGCTGYEYTLEATNDVTVNELDYIFEATEFVVVIDKITFLKFFKGGTVLEYKTEGLNAGLHFRNPNVGSECGCGESFNLLKDE